MYNTFSCKLLPTLVCTVHGDTKFGKGENKPACSRICRENGAHRLRNSTKTIFVAPKSVRNIYGAFHVNENESLFATNTRVGSSSYVHGATSVHIFAVDHNASMGNDVHSYSSRSLFSIIFQP